MSQWPPGPAGTYGASCPSTRMRKRSASTLPSGSSGIPLPWKDTRVHIQLHLFCDQVKRRQPQEQCANCNRLNSSWRFPQQNPIMREGERIWVKPWHCEEATGWGRWLLQVHFWFEELAVITSLRKDSKITEWFVIYSCCICPSQWFDISYETSSQSSEMR